MLPLLKSHDLLDAKLVVHLLQLRFIAVGNHKQTVADGQFGVSARNKIFAS